VINHSLFILKGGEYMIDGGGHSLEKDMNENV